MANQMFMYAAALNLSKGKQTKYCLSNLSNLKYFNLTRHEHLRNNLKYFWFRISNFFKKYQFEHFQDNFKDYTSLLLSCPSNCWLYGYFQGEQYFSDSKDEVRKRFEIKEKYKIDYANWSNNYSHNKRMVAVHVRRKDYKDFKMEELGGPDLCLPSSFYWKLLQRFINNNEYLIVFLSDEICEVEQEFNTIPNAIFLKKSAIVDLQILMKADILILANSSFSWWGAWLNQNPNKIIYVPKYFLGFKVKKEYPVNIIPENWIQIDVYE